MSVKYLSMNVKSALVNRKEFGGVGYFWKTSCVSVLFKIRIL